MLYMENAREMFSESKSSCLGKPRFNEEVYFYHNIATLVPDKIDVDNLILVMKMALLDCQKRKINTIPFIGLVPRYIDKCASVEFAEEFRRKYIDEILGIERKAIQEGEYEVKEIEEDVIDISDKDRNEVLAILYNYSVPVGMGFMQYNPQEWDENYAEYAFANLIEKRSEHEFYIGYLQGRAMDLAFNDNLLYVKAYNINNGHKLAQKLLSTIPNKTDVLKKVKSD